MNSDSWSPAGRTFNRIPLPDPIPYAEVNIDLNWTADEHSRHDEERPPHDTSFRPSSNCVLQSSLNKPSGVRESKGAGRFGRAKVWLSEVRQYFLTLALVITADGLKGLRALQSLNLSGCCRLTNLDALKGLTALRDLDVTRSSISPDEIAVLQRALPSTDIRQ